MTHAGQVLSLDTLSGQLTTQYTLGEPLDSSAAFDLSGNIYIATYSGEVISLDSGGQERWRFSPPVPGTFAKGGIALNEDQGILYVANAAHQVSAISMTDGNLLWEFVTRAPVYGAPILGDGNKLYLTAFDQTLYCLNALSGEYQWEFQTGRPIFGLTPALDSQGRIIFGSEDPWLYAVDNEGFEQWSYVMEAGLVSSPIIGSNGHIYAGAINGSLYALDMAGKLRWKYQVGSGFSTAPILGIDGVLYAGSDQGRLFALNQAGQLLWSQLVSPYPIVALTLDPTGSLYVLSNNGSVSAFQTSSLGLDNAGWPKVHGNNLNSGRKN